ncbi:type VII secretion target [Amycolatopsis sp. VS8301801F10]|uniref:type VII secretion target n=1 Tax=Amycolatopsis sp. VS8301801F10 TaxID=2652442 RepID=UPI0038FC10D7
MTGNGFTVHPDELHKFSEYLDKTTVPAVDDSAKAVDDANGGDIDAFGVVLAQVLAIPARIALKAVSDNLHGVAKDVTDSADKTRQASEQYRKGDQDLAKAFDKFKPEQVK